MRIVACNDGVEWRRLHSISDLDASKSGPLDELSAALDVLPAGRTVISGAELAPKPPRAAELTAELTRADELSGATAAMSDGAEGPERPADGAEAAAGRVRRRVARRVAGRRRGSSGAGCATGGTTAPTAR